MWEREFSKLSTVMARQQGVITTAQANRLGISTEVLGNFKASGLVVELEHEVYQLHSDPVGPRYAYPFAAWLALRPELFGWERAGGERDAVVSHESACQLHGMGAMRAPLMMFTMPETCQAPPATIIYVSQLSAEDVTTCVGIPVTTPRRTVSDLVRDWTEHGDISRVLTDAAHRDLVDLQDVHRDLKQLAVEHEFPSDGREFVQYFAPDLTLDLLSPRNIRAYAALMFPEKVAELVPKVQRLLEDARGGDSFDVAKSSAQDEGFSMEIAADIVGRSVQE